MTRSLLHTGHVVDFTPVPPFFSRAGRVKV
jgi:hypothetical protein